MKPLVGPCRHAAPASFARNVLQSNRGFSTSRRAWGYADTLHNLKIGAHTKVLFQGFTGRQATANAKESLAWGTKIVGGVKPGVEGEHLGLPVFPSVRAAQEKAKPDASAIYVPGNQTAQAIEEAIEAEIPLVVAVAEHVPLHDMLRVHSMLQAQSKTRLVGANCPGIISAIGKCRIGFQPLPYFSPGKIGIVAKSGTLSYETVASTTRAGLGQSLCISMGGDVLPGTSFVDALQIFEHDPDTEGIILIGEVGGTAEIEAAEWIRHYYRRTSDPKPIMALVAGKQAPRDRAMGHAGAWAARGEPDAQAKHVALENAGAVLVNHPENFGEGMKVLLNRRARRFEGTSSFYASSQRRSFHTLRRTRVRAHSGRHYTPTSMQIRSLYLTQDRILDMLRKKIQLPIELSPPSPTDFILSITVDRTFLSPCMVAEPVGQSIEARKFPFAYTTKHFSSEDPNVSAVAEHLECPRENLTKLAALIDALWNIFTEKEAVIVQVTAGFVANGDVEVRGTRAGFDDAAFRSSGRQEDVHRPSKEEALKSDPWEEVQAEEHGIVYIKLTGEGSIGTLVNGAGLAMNTVDAISLHGGHCANFLDTGGKATVETVELCFKVITRDQRVKVIFVNIFGGLTRCDMIAEGIILAFKNLHLALPVVVRLRGTNEELGQKMIAESGLPLYAFDSFEEAAKKAISLAESVQR